MVTRSLSLLWSSNQHFPSKILDILKIGFPLQKRFQLSQGPQLARACVLRRDSEAKFRVCLSRQDSKFTSEFTTTFLTAGCLWSVNLGRKGNQRTRWSPDQVFHHINWGKGTTKWNIHPFTTHILRHKQKMHLTNDWKHPDVVLALRVGLALEVAVVLVLQRARPVDALKRKQLSELGIRMSIWQVEVKSALNKRLEYFLDECVYPSTFWDTLPSYKMNY